MYENILYESTDLSIFKILSIITKIIISVENVFCLSESSLMEGNHIYILNIKNLTAYNTTMSYFNTCDHDLTIVLIENNFQT